MSKSEIADREARKLIREQLDINMFVEAGAGSGKTSSLVGRAATLVAAGQVTLAQLAVVTFTRKAAGELRERLQLELEHMMPSAQGEARERLLQAMDDLNRCFIGTIHSFCASLLRERPVEAGLSPDFKEIEGVAEQLMEARAWDIYLQKVSPQLIDDLESVGLKPKQLYDAYRRINTYPEVNFTCQPYPRPDFDLVRVELKRLLDTVGAKLPIKEPEKGWDKLQEKLRQIQQWQRLFDLGNDLVLAELLEKLEGNAPVTQNRWGSKEIALEMKAVYEAFQITVVRPTLEQWRKHRYRYIMEFIRPAAAEYIRLRHEENILNFQDLLLRTAAMLKSDSEVRQYFQNRYRVLLVDEFQDTDPIQAEIMMYLTGEDCQQQDWTLLRPRPGSLFVVGDPKQSIYRFRRADIDIFYQVRTQIMAAGGVVLGLTQNFRTLPGIVDWVNTAFGSILERTKMPYQASYSPMIAARQDDTKGLNGLRVIELNKEANHNGGRIAEQDAKRIGAYISQLIAGQDTILTPEGSLKPLTPEDFMILVQVKKNMSLYARELERLGIPYTISGQNHMGSSITLNELLYLLQAIDDPGNPVILAAVLRGRFYGFSDQDLYDFHQAGGSFNFESPVPEMMEPDIEDRFKEAYQQLSAFRKLALERMPVAVIEQIAEQIGVIPLLIAEGAGNALANYYFLIDCLRKAEGQGITCFDQLVMLFQQFLEVGAEDEIDLHYGQVKGVRIMNLHKAKGLEAPVVFLADPGSRASEKVNLHVRRQGICSEGWLEITEPTGDYATRILARPPEWENCCSEEAAYLEAERERLLYVAATRVKNLLVVSSYSEKPEKSPWESLLPYLDQVPPIADNPAVINIRNPKAPAPNWEEYVTDKDQRNQSRQQSSQASFTNVTVTAAAHQAITYRTGTGRGRGPAWGNAVHMALEKLAHRPKLIHDAVWLTGVLQEAECDIGDLEVYRSLLTDVMKTELWQRIMAASVKLTEVPFGIWEKPEYLKGTIDLVFQEAGGWVIVDYKSDAVADEADLCRLIEQYRPQVSHYAHCWSRLTGENVIEHGILFTHIGRFVNL